MPKVGIVVYAPSQLNSFVKTGVLSRLRSQQQLRVFSTRQHVIDVLREDYHEIAERVEIPNIIRRVSGFVQMVSLWKYRDRTMNHLVRAMASFGTKKHQDAWKCVVVSEMKISAWKRFFVRFMSLSFCFYILRHLEFMLRRLFLVNRFREIVDKVDILLVPFSGHIGADFGNLVWAAQRLKIPVVGLQENWDNLATKTFILEEPNYFLVWGDQSAGHLRSVHRMFSAEIKIVGSPRFAPYFERIDCVPTVSSEDGSKVVLQNKQFVLVAGTGDGIDDEMLVRLVASNFASRTNRVLNKNFDIVYRPHPLTRTAVNHSKLQAEFKSLYIDNGTDSRKYGHHNALVKGAALVINHFSTLSVESLLCGTPVMVPLFLGRPEAKYRYNHILNEWHHMMGMGLIAQIKTPRTQEEFSEQITEVLAKQSFSTRREINLDWVCKESDYVKELSNFINSVFS